MLGTPVGTPRIEPTDTTTVVGGVVVGGCTFDRRRRRRTVIKSREAELVVVLDARRELTLSEMSLVAERVTLCFAFSWRRTTKFGTDVVVASRSWSRILVVDSTFERSRRFVTLE